MNNINPAGFAVLVVVGGFCIYIAIRYFWSVLIVFAAVFLFAWLHSRYTAKKAEKASAQQKQKEMQQQMQQKWVDQPEVIDAEFTLKEEAKEND